MSAKRRLGYVKSQTNKNNPQSIPELKDEIIYAIGEIDPKCQHVIEHFNGRGDICEVISITNREIYQKSIFSEAVHFLNLM